MRPPEQLSADEGAALLGARARLNEALRTVRALRSSPARSRAIYGEVREVISGGALESEELDDFGKAALGELGLAVPSLVERDADGVPESLDREAVTAFLRYGRRDPARALILPARDEVALIERTVEDSDAGAETRIPPRGRSGDLPVSAYLQDAEDDVQPVWPELAGRLHVLREGLAAPAGS